MAAYYKQNLVNNKKKVSISFVIRDKEERRHRSGVNSLQYDSTLSRLYSAGRDSVIRIWNLGDERDNSSENLIRSPLDTKTTDHFYRSMEHHTDWVNDISLCCDGKNLISVSNDTTIKVWNAHQGFCLSTLRSHKDYAKCLAYARDKEIIASAGFDRVIYLWDIQALTMLTATKNTVTTKPLDGSKSSIYSLAINSSGTLVASGSTEKVIRLWDPRTRQKFLKLRGHTDNVRSLIFSKDGSLLLSASSDSTIRLWSITQQRCISIIRVHDEGVWTLQTNESFSAVYSGGKDQKIFMTNLKNTSEATMICKEKAPVLRLLLIENNKARSQSSLWVSTTESTIRRWPLIKDKSPDVERNLIHVEDSTEMPLRSSPNLTILGNPSVIDYHILDDKRHILTRESDNSIALYDVLTARKIDTIHAANSDPDSKKIYEDEVKNRFKMVYVPNWFSVDLKIGLLCIHLEETDCLSAWVSARDYGFAPHIEGQDPKVNLGTLMLQALFEQWPPTFDLQDNHDYQLDSNSDNTNFEDRSSSQHIPRPGYYPSRYKSVISDRRHANGTSRRSGNNYFSIANHTPIIISEGSQTILRFLAYEASNESEDLLIQELIPGWINDIVISKNPPKFTKIPFFLLPHTNSGIKSLRKERLSASDMLQMHKIIEHVCEKMIVNITDENGCLTTVDQEGPSHLKTSCQENSKVFPMDKVELYCNDQRLDESMDLRTVRHYIWKAGGDLVLHYMPIN